MDPAGSRGRAAARGLAALWLAGAFFLGVPAAASAASMASFGFDGAPIVGEDPTVVPDVTAAFGWDDGLGELHVSLSYNAGDVYAIGQALSAVTFELEGDAVVSDALQASLGAGSELVGAGATLAESQLAALGGADDVSGHWAYAHAGGTEIVGSVGDAGLGPGDLIDGTRTADIESNAPNGTRFSIVPDGVCDAAGCGGLTGGFQMEDGVWIESRVDVWLAYEGRISGITEVTPLFGTDAAPATPEPGAALVFGLGLGAVACSVRRRGRR